MKIFNKSFYFWHPKNEFQRNFGTIEKKYIYQKKIISK